MTLASHVHYIEPTRTNNQQTMQIAKIFKKICDGDAFDEFDWIFVVGLGMTLLTLVTENYQNNNKTITFIGSSNPNHSSRKKRSKK